MSGDAEQAGGLTDDCDCGPGEHTLACDARFGTRVRILAARAAGPADDTAHPADSFNRTEPIYEGE